MSTEIAAHEYESVARLMEQGKTLEDALAIVRKPQSPAPDKPKRNQGPKAKARLFAYLEERADVIREYRFHPVRRWRFDAYLPEYTIGVEYDGLMSGDASHASVNNILRDAEKINAAQAMGIRVFRANAKSIWDGSFFELMDTVLVKTLETSDDE